MPESYRPRRIGPSRRARDGRTPNYAARRIVEAAAALGALLAVAGASALALGGPPTAWFGRGEGQRGSVSAVAPSAPASAAASGVATSPASRVASAAAATHAASATVEVTPSADATITIAAVGDMMFGRGVSDFIHANGGTAILSKVASVLSGADVTVGNLEGPLAKSGTAAAGKDVTLLGDPAAIAGLEKAGFDAVGLANNHALDFGKTALKNTLSLLDKAGIAHSGAGMNRASAQKPAVVQAGGAKVAFLSFSHILPAGFIATDSKPGIARSKGGMDQVAEAIRQAKKANDHVVVSFHWGIEYSPDANSEQRRDARRAIDAGADLVVGEHPHVIQGLEVYKGRLIAYSLGDFVFDHYSRETGESFILLSEVGPGGVAGARVVPTYLGSGSGRPAVVKGTAAQRILKRLQRISKTLSTNVIIKGDEATVEIR
jgi:poly-gamma-glutamate capsule biosynthesis protein CapA/YwtB (metallophosphatase superfamily)